MARSRNYNWVWFFIVMVVIAVVMAGSNLLYNLRQQLTPEALAAAQALWERAGPADYDMRVTKNVVSGGGPGLSDVITVKVRGKRPTDVQLNGKPLEPRLWPEYDMPAMFEWVERFLQIDRAPGAPPVFCVARFDTKDGHLIGFVRSVRATQERQDLKVDFRIAPPGP
jgi:hypothetical protein